MFHQSENKKIQRQNRGEVSENEPNRYAAFSDDELIALLKSDKPAERTCAAKLLGKRKPEKAIKAMCLALQNEKSLYPRIAISEALGEIGLPALRELIRLLGIIGNNQHKTLPDKVFAKKNYPLPRDIVARTITKMGKNALEMLVQSLSTLGRESLSEAIDAIGFISYYSGNQLAFAAIRYLIHQYEKDDLILWKLIRALQAFPNQESICILEFFKQNHPNKAIRNEAERSIWQISIT